MANFKARNLLARHENGAPVWAAGQDFARITVEKFDVRIRFQLRLSDGRMGWIAIELDAYESGLWENSAPAMRVLHLGCGPITEFALEGKPTDCGVKEKTFRVETNAPNPSSRRMPCDCAQSRG